MRQDSKYNSRKDYKQNIRQEYKYNTIYNNTTYDYKYYIRL